MSPDYRYDFTRKADYLFFLFTQGGPDDGTSVVRVVRNVTAHELAIVESEFKDPAFHGGELYYDVHGAIQLAREQTHYSDTHIMQPKQFMLITGEGVHQFLSECEQYVPSFLTPPDDHIVQMERDANKNLEDQLDEERADGEGMYVDEPLWNGAARLGQDQ